MDATITEVQPSRGRTGVEETREPQPTSRRRRERRERVSNPNDATWPSLPRSSSPRNAAASLLPSAAASTVSVRTTRGQEIVVPAPVAVIGLASLLLAVFF